jgi:hypothetical protein
MTYMHHFAFLNGCSGKFGPLSADVTGMPLRPNNSFKPTPHRGVGHVPALR